MSSENACGEPYPNKSLGVVNYKLTAAKFSEIKTWVANNAGGLSNAAGCNNNDNTWIGDPYPNGAIGWGSSSCPACGSYTWGGACGCGTIPMPGPIPMPLPQIYPTYPPFGSSTFGNKTLITKGKEKADILGDFFGPEVHALVVLDEADGGARFVPFMDKLNMIWLQETLNSWAAYDKNEFLDFVNSDQTVFLGTKLNKTEVLKRMMKPEDPPESLK
jgi:hypothetical protein